MARRYKSAMKSTEESAASATGVFAIRNTVRITSARAGARFPAGALGDQSRPCNHVSVYEIEIRRHRQTASHHPGRERIPGDLGGRPRQGAASRSEHAHRRAAADEASADLLQPHPIPRRPPLRIHSPQGPAHEPHGRRRDSKPPSRRTLRTSRPRSSSTREVLSLLADNLDRHGDVETVTDQATSA